MDDGGGPGGPSVTITVTRNTDDAVPCEDLPGGDGDVCPPIAPADYAWTGTVELTAPGNTNGWSTTIRRNGVDGGVVVWTGVLENGETHDFGPEGQPAGIAPGGSFTFTVTCNELLGDGSVSDTANASVPNCADCGAVYCEDPENPPNQIECPEGQTLNLYDCLCYGGGCPDGQEWNGSECIPICLNGKVWNGGECACPANTEWNGTACQPCPSLGTVIDLGPCENGGQYVTIANGDCTTYTTVQSCAPDP